MIQINEEKKRIKINKKIQFQKKQSLRYNLRISLFNEKVMLRSGDILYF